MNRKQRRQMMRLNIQDTLAFCPIHGKTTVNKKGIFQCGCFDEDGNKIVHLTDNPNKSVEF
jgi:hypothetical protein